MISLLVPLPGLHESRRNCTSEKPTAKTTQRSRAPTKGLSSPTSNRPRPPASRGAGSVPLRRCNRATARPPLRAGAGHAVHRRTRRSSTRGQIGYRYASRLAGRIGDAVVCASASRCPSRAARPRSGRAPRPEGCRAHPVAASRRRNRAIATIISTGEPAILVHPHKVWRPPAGVVARGTGRKHRLSSVTVADQPPGLSAQVLVERMRMPDFRRDGVATLRALGAQRRVPFCSARAALRWQEPCPDLTAPNAGAPVGAAARWTAPAVKSRPRVDRSTPGRERASAG